MGRLYLRPAILQNVGANDFAHVQLLNPTGSGVTASKIVATVHYSRELTVLGAGDEVFGGGFPDPEGLPPLDGGSRWPSKIHARSCYRDENHLVQGGQFSHHVGIQDGWVYVFPGNLGPGTMLLFRNNQKGQWLSISFRWEEA